MNRINDGGPAFPENGSRGKASGGEGMSLRDYFAAKAMAALIVARGAEIVERGWPTHAEVDAYYIADAMLRAREQGEPK